MEPVFKITLSTSQQITLVGSIDASAVRGKPVVSSVTIDDRTHDKCLVLLEFRPFAQLNCYNLNPEICKANRCESFAKVLPIDDASLAAIKAKSAPCLMASVRVSIEADTSRWATTV